MHTALSIGVPCLADRANKSRAATPQHQGIRPHDAHIGAYYRNKLITANLTLSADCLKQVPMRAIISVTASHFGLTADDIKGPSQRAEIASARQVAMYVAHAAKGLNLSTIGFAFNRDHTTVLYAIRKVQTTCQASSSASRNVAVVLSKLGAWYAHNRTERVNG